MFNECSFELRELISGSSGSWFLISHSQFDFHVIIIFYFQNDFHDRISIDLFGVTHPLDHWLFPYGLSMLLEVLAMEVLNPDLYPMKVMCHMTLGRPYVNSWLCIAHLHRHAFFSESLHKKKDDLVRIVACIANHLCWFFIILFI